MTRCARPLVAAVAAVLAAAGATGASAADADRTGVTRSTVMIGLHAPLTGSSPFPQVEAERAARRYWQSHRVAGRTVRVVVVDDRSTSSDEACRGLAQSVLLILSAGEPAATAACAGSAALRSVPYLAPGAGLAGPPAASVFAVSATPAQDVTALTALVRRRAVLQGSWAIVAPGAGPQRALADAARSRLTAAGVPSSLVLYRGDGTGVESLRVAAVLQRQGQPVALVLGRPATFRSVSGWSRSRGYVPQWVSFEDELTTTSGAQQVCGGASPELRLAVLSAVPGLDRVPAEARAAGVRSDTDLRLWGLSEVVSQALGTAGGDLRRSVLLRRLDHAALPGGVLAPLEYAPGRHAGATATWLVRLACTPAPTVTTGGLVPVG